MKAVAAIGVILGVIALILAAMAFKVAYKNDESIKTLKAESTASREKGVVPPAGSDLRDILRQELAHLSGQVAALAATPKAPAGNEPQITEERVREIVREEAQTAMRGLFGRAPMVGGGALGGPADFAQRLRDRVGLDEQKAAQVAPIVQKAVEEIGNIFRENRGGGRDQNVALVQEQTKKTEEEIAKILTPEEMEKFKAAGIWGRQGGAPDAGFGRNRGGRGGAQEPAGAVF